MPAPPATPSRRSWPTRCCAPASAPRRSWRPHKTLVTDKVPKPQETVVAAATVVKKGRVLPPDAYRCKAKTLAGKQCPFKATCMGFCSKHQVMNKI